MHSFAEFCNTTGIRGLTWTYKAKSMPERFLWAFVVATCLVMTVWDVSAAVAKYSESAISTKVVVLNNKTFSLGNTTLCMYMALSKVVMSHNGLNISNLMEVKQFFDQFDDVNLTVYIDERLEDLKQLQGDSKRKDLLDHPFNNLILLSSIVISNILRVELIVKSNTTTADFQWGTRNFFAPDPSPLESETSESIKYTYEFLMSKQTNLRSLVRRVTAGLCYLMDFEVRLIVRSLDQGQTVTNNFDLCQSQASWFGTEPFFETYWDLLCFKLPSELLQFSTAYDYASLQFDKHRFPEPTAFEEEDTTKVYVDFTGAPVSTVKDKNVLSLNQNVQTGVSVQLSGHFKPLASAKTPCSRATTSLDCLLEGYSEYVKASCLCDPLFTEFLLNSKRELPECQNSQLDSLEIPGYNATKDCLNLPSVTPVNSKYETQCYPACEKKIFNYMNIRVSDFNTTDFVTKFSILVDLFMYPLFEDFYLIEPKQFLAQLGGSLSLWLGANFLALFHLAVFLLKWPFEAKKQNSNQIDLDQRLIALMDERIGFALKSCDVAERERKLN